MLTPENQHDWREEPDGSRVRRANGIRIVDRRAAEPEPTAIEHLVARDDGAGGLVIVGLDATCKPVYVTTMYSYL